MEVWQSLTSIQTNITNMLDSYGARFDEPGMDRFNRGNWVNQVWVSPHFRRAHLDVVDARDTHGLWMMHVCVFPHLDSDAPIFGFDVVAGRGKMTGAFHDFSPSVTSDHEMIDNFGRTVSSLNWKRERELPDWAKAIFSDHMMAAGNVREEKEIEQVEAVVKLNIATYLSGIRHFRYNANPQDVRDAHNRYAKYQKMNPHTPRVMKKLGLDEQDVDDFIEKCLFPEI